jgi:hypothetical protein
MNLDNQRLREIQQYKLFYEARLKEDNTELEHDLLEMKLNQLKIEEKEILERSL